jgi:hypothetical protein
MHSQSAAHGGTAHGGTAGALSVAADQQIAIAIMWAVPAICFVPVIYALVISWLGEREDPGRQSAMTPPAGAQPRPVSLPRPPGGGAHRQGQIRKTYTSSWPGPPGMTR